MSQTEKQVNDELPPNTDSDKTQPPAAAEDDPAPPESMEEDAAPPEELKINYPPVKKKKREPKLLESSDPNIQVEVRSHKRGPKKRTIIVYDDTQPQIKVVHKKRKAEVQHVQEEEEEPDISKLKPRELEKYKKLLKFREAQQLTGKKLRLTKKWQVDGRSKGERSEAQKASINALIKRNHERRTLQKMQKDMKNKEDLKETAKTVVSATISEMAKAKPQAPAPAPAKKISTKDLFSN